MAKKEENKKAPPEKKVDSVTAEMVWSAIESGLEEKVEELCKRHEDLGIVLLELAPEFRHHAVQTRHAELDSRWDDMDAKEQLKRWRAFCHKWVEVKGLTTFKGKKMDLDYVHAEYRGEVDPEEC